MFTYKVCQTYIFTLLETSYDDIGTTGAQLYKYFVAILNLDIIFRLISVLFKNKFTICTVDLALLIYV